MSTILNWRVILGGIFLAIILCLGLGLLTLAFRPDKLPQAAQPTAGLTIIPADTPTAIALPDSSGLPSATPASGSSKGGIEVGVYVQISGTGGDGLRLRSGPGVKSAPLFLGMEAEVYQVKDGPKDADGYTWWYLEAPYDQQRKGWAASKYLTIVAQPPAQ
jgi:hypothetical protein